LNLRVPNAPSPRGGESARHSGSRAPFPSKQGQQWRKITSRRMEPPAWPFEILAVLIVVYSVLVPESLRLTCCCLCLCLCKAAREPDASCSTKEEKSENETVRGAGIAVVVPVWPSRLPPRSCCAVYCAILLYLLPGPAAGLPDRFLQMEELPRP
jgi:hypothetical protein